MERNIKEKGLDILAGKIDNKLLTNLNSCVRCGLCADSCMFFKALNEPKYIPARKVALVSSVYRRYFTLSGKIAPALVNAKELDDHTAEEMVDLLFGACTMCGRCVKHCSIGVDIPYFVRKGREMLAAMDMVPATLQATVDSALTTGNNMGIPEEEFTGTISWMEEELIDEMGDDKARIPLNEMHKEIFYTLNPREPKFFPAFQSLLWQRYFMRQMKTGLSHQSSTILPIMDFLTATKHRRDRLPVIFMRKFIASGEREWFLASADTVPGPTDGRGQIILAESMILI